MTFTATLLAAALGYVFGRSHQRKPRIQPQSDADRYAFESRRKA